MLFREGKPCGACGGNKKEIFMSKNIIWKDSLENTLVLRITDGQSAVSRLTPAEEPFTTDIGEDDDLFAPIRTGSGYIRVVIDHVDDIADLVGSAPINRKVTLSVNNTVRWTGFLSCETFTQPWDRGPIEVELPVSSPLEVARGLVIAGVAANLKYISFADFLVRMNTALLSPYNMVYFPCLSEPETTLRYLFDLRGYVSHENKNTTNDFASFYDILEDICKLFGWQAVEVGTYLCFLAADTKKMESGGAYKGFTPAQLASIALGNTVTPVIPTFSPVTVTIFGAEHHRTFLAGKKSVEVGGDLRERDETIWAMDIAEQCEFNRTLRNGSGTTIYDVKLYKMPTIDGVSGNIRVRNSVDGMDVYDTIGNNIKYLNYIYPSSGTRYGGSVGYEMMYTYDTEHEVIKGEKEYIARIITKGNTSEIIDCAEIHTNFFYDPTQNTDGFRIDADVKYAFHADDIFEKKDGEYYGCIIALQIGNYYYNPQTGWTTSMATIRLLVKDGKIEGYGYRTESDAVFRSFIPVSDTVSGEVVLHIMASADSRQYYGQGDRYIAYENLGIRLSPENATRASVKIEGKEQRSDVNKKIIKINTGFTSEWSMESGLTVAREPVPDSYGAVLTAGKEIPTSLYGNEYPEDALAERASAYFGQSRQKINAIVRCSDQMLAPYVPYQFQDGGQQFICISQKMNWKTNRNEASFYEPSE